MVKRKMGKLIILLHRYLGIALALIFVLWFASGFAIIYTGGMPTLTENERLTRLPDLNLESISVTPFHLAKTEFRLGEVLLK